MIMAKYTIPQVEKMLLTMQILVDTREQITEKYLRRLEGFNYPSERTKLDYGDYSCKYLDVSYNEQNLANIAVVERKMNLDEVCYCFTSERSRFKREFERAKNDKARVHLIIEDDNYERLFVGKYRSKLAPQALIASILTWSMRYNLQLHFCKSETTGKLIGQIMHYELREYLLSQ